MILAVEKHTDQSLARTFMKANVFRGPGRFGLEEKPIPQAGPGEAVVRVRLTTICGTDIHIVRGEYPVRPGLTIGHEAVGVIHEIGPGVTGYHLGQRVLVGPSPHAGSVSRAFRITPRSAVGCSEAGNSVTPSTVPKLSTSWFRTPKPI
jgi:Zn-dependent alcohol dehydrogenases